MFYNILFLLIFFLIFCGGLWNAPWLPTYKKDFERIANLIKIRPRLTFYDLGSGNADLLFYLSKQYGIHCIGIEISPVLYLYSKIKSLFYKNVTIKYGNFFNHDLKKADIIYCFLTPKVHHKLKEKLRKEIKKETIIILSCWPFKKVKPFKIDKKNRIPFYVYKKINI